ncbi:copper resistance system multicopper oxidase [Novosphingobium bradum]|uniref:Copper resistance system multicopper oxidase n=1 Tax=Novosphingobium bradum TaxID=1737444 RepID=A0ABV7IRX2_9SPHN
MDRPPPDAALLTRRALLRSGGSLAAGLALAPLFPAWAQSGTSGAGLGTTGLTIAPGHAMVGGRAAHHAVMVNGTIPGPLVRLREGDVARIAVSNRLAEPTSIHWHGLLVPFQMDGVPGVSFPGITPGETFAYEFPLIQSGTYWYHGHSGMQEALGLYGPLIIDPAGPDPIGAEREHVIMLADWSPLHPHEQLRRLKIRAGYFNRRHQDLAGLLAGRDQPLAERLEWARMRMDPTDIADVTGATYAYLINGHDTAANWTGLFRPGERVRLRIINASAMTNFNFRIPGLALSVVAADGNLVQPVETDELQIAIAETYDILVTPTEDKAFGVIAEALDRSGQVRGTLAPRQGMAGDVPALRQRPLLTMRDMGMDMGGMDMGGMDMAGMDMGHGGVIDLSQPANPAMGGHAMAMRDKRAAPQVAFGPAVATIAPAPVDRLADRPTGLEAVDHRVLTYAQLRALARNPDGRAPGRQIDLHLTANMDRYMWSIDGQTMADGAAPIPLREGERVRMNLINDTMMPHPIHLHGHFFELVSGEPGHRARKHTVNVLPGGRVAFDLTADAPGDWAFHCHMLLHMHAGMMRVVTVRRAGDQA